MAQRLTFTRIARFFAARFTRKVNPLESPRLQRERAFAGFISILAPITVIIGAYDLLTARWQLAALNILLFACALTTFTLAHRHRTEAATNLAFWGSALLFGVTGATAPTDSPLSREMTVVFVTSVSTAALILIGLYARRRYQIYTMFAIALLTSIAWYATGSPLSPQTIQILVSYSVILVLCLLIAIFEWRLSQNAENQLQARRALIHQLEQIHFAESRALAEVKETFAAASHDIRTPVTVVTNVARLLEGTPLTATQKRYIEMLKNSSDAIFGIVSEGFDGKTKFLESSPPMRLINLGAFLEDIAGSHAAVTERSGTTVEILGTEKLPPIRVPLTDLTRIVNNLLQNAIKYTVKGRITIAAAIERQSSEAVTGLLRISVSDTGTGMSRGRLAEVRNGTNGPDTNMPSSRGIGLEICRSLLSGHHGSLAIDSREGKGTVVTVELSLAFEPGNPE